MRLSPKPGAARAWIRRNTNPGLLGVRATHLAKVAAASAGISIGRADRGGRRYLSASYDDSVPLPPGAERALRADNPELAELERAYAELRIAATAHTQWRAGFLKRNLSMAHFRGDNAYVWQFRQLRAAAETRVYLQLIDAESRDRLGLLDKLDEDGAFGAWTFRYGDRAPVSRDLIDSVNEINYLDDRIGIGGIDGLRVLDIGAGYGRLAHRMSAALPNLAAYDCIDGVATSTFLCDYYLRHRGVPDSVRVVRLDRHRELGDRYDLAVNIHSFAECSIDAIQWWLDRIAERRIDWLLIVPNTPPELVSMELDGRRIDFTDRVRRAGYELADSRPVHESDELRELIGVEDRFFLFRRAAS